MVKVEQKVTGMVRNVKVATEIPPGIEIKRVAPGKAHGLEKVEMRARGGARLPPPDSRRKRDKSKVMVRATQDNLAAAVAFLKFGK